MEDYPVTFNEKKLKILEGLNRPQAQYSDLSPKGSVDDGVRDVIGTINTINGLVTTSSCAGRIAVFLEGRQKARDKAIPVGSEAPRSDAPTKGLGGNWLFVSHERINVDDHRASLSQLLNLSQGQPGLRSVAPSQSRRFVKFQFEPMILHVLCASLQHAQGVLVAAVNAGFRESGVASLKNLDDPNALPVVAVRTAGLALSSIVACKDEQSPVENGQTNGEPLVPLVDERYLRILVDEANRRFGVNEARIERFHSALQDLAVRSNYANPKQKGFAVTNKVKAKASLKTALRRKDEVNADDLGASVSMFEDNE